MEPSSEIARLIAIMAALRAPVGGCPWDVEQTFSTIAPFTIEEAYEVVDAITRGDMLDLKDELGDLLLQVVFHARMAEEAGHFSFPDVVMAITSKLIRRHPHIFANDVAEDPAAVKAVWAKIKVEEKAARAAARAAAGVPDELPTGGLLGGIKPALPAFLRALKLQEKASTVGFDWNDARLVLDKIEEEAREVREALEAGKQTDIEEEIGDLLFAAVNLARHAKADPEACLQRANTKFTARFSAIEAALARQGRTLENASLEEMETLWVKAKAVLAK